MFYVVEEERCTLPCIFFLIILFKKILLNMKTAASFPPGKQGGGGLNQYCFDAGPALQTLEKH